MACRKRVCLGLDHVLKGVENIAVLDNVRPFEGKVVMQLASILQARGYVVILMHRKNLAGIGHPDHKWGFIEAENVLILPPMNLNDIPSSITHCISAGNVTINPTVGKDDNTTVEIMNAIFQENNHPTRFGELVAAQMLGHNFEEAHVCYIDMSMPPPATAKISTPEVPIYQYGSTSSTVPYC